MEPLTFWTAFGALTLVASWIIGALRSSDKDAVDTRFTGLEEKVDTIALQVTDKAHKDELHRIEARFEREFLAVRNEIKDGFTEMKQDNKDLANEMKQDNKDLAIELKQAIKDVISK